MVSIIKTVGKRFSNFTIIPFPTPINIVRLLYKLKQMLYLTSWTSYLRFNHTFMLVYLRDPSDVLRISLLQGNQYVSRRNMSLCQISNMLLLIGCQPTNK